VALLPNHASAILDLRKLADYCLSAVHPRGRHKARVFREALGISQTDAVWLREALLNGLVDGTATEIVADRFGQRWSVDIPVTRHGKQVVVRTLWIVRKDEQAPRFVTCWVR
jgi:hypothetical protein